MDDPEPAAAPETSDGTTVHENVVPGTVPVKAMDVLVVEQIVCVAGVVMTTGNAFTVIRTGLLEILPHEFAPVVVATIW